jgi:cytochrome oxidase assembly protein ShyY1
LPAIPPPPPGVRTLRALYAPPPGSGVRLGGNALPRQAQWPKTTIYLDIAEVSADLRHALDPRVMLETDADDAAIGFVREWRPEVFPPARHYAYAFTWFAFCAVVVATFIGLHWKKQN